MNELDDLDLGSSEIGLLSSFSLAHLSPDEKLDIAEVWLLEHGGEYLDFGAVPTFYELIHHFTPGLYVRQAISKPGSVVVSKTCKLEHPFIVTQGILSVYGINDGPMTIHAPYFGITKPDTRRFIFTHEDAVWWTFHANPNELRDIAELEKYIWTHRDNPLLDCNHKPLRRSIGGNV